MITVKPGETFNTDLLILTDEAIPWQALSCRIQHDSYFLPDTAGIQASPEIQIKSPLIAAKRQNDKLTSIAIQLDGEIPAMAELLCATLSWSVAEDTPNAIYTFSFDQAASQVYNASNEELVTGYESDSLKVTRISRRFILKIRVHN